MWLHNRAWADRLIAATKVAGNIKQIDPIGSILKNESQARALTKLKPEILIAVVAEAENSSTKITARGFEKIAKKYNSLDTNGTKTENVGEIDTSQEKLANFQELCRRLSDLKRTDTYIRDWLDDLWIQVNKLPDSREISGIKFRLKILFYQNEIIGNCIALEEINLSNNPWGFSVR